MDREQINNIVKDLKKIIKNSIKEGKTMDDIAYLNEVKNLIGETSCIEEDDFTNYAYGLGKYYGRITKSNLDKDEVKDFGCKKIDTNEGILEITQFKDNKINIDLYVNVSWLDKYDNYHDEFCNLKTWNII